MNASVSVSPADNFISAAKPADRQTMSATSEAVPEILQLLQEKALTQFPAFPEAFGQLQYICVPDSETVFETDGLHLYVRPELVTQYFLNDFVYLHRCYLHVHLHCLCFHIVHSEHASDKLRDLACDLSAELMSELLLSKKSRQNKTSLRERCEQLLQKSSQKQPGEQYESIHHSKQSNITAPHDCIWSALQELRQTGWLDAKTILPLFDVCLELENLAAECTFDSHDHWFRKLVSYSESARASADDASAAKPGTSTRHLTAEQIQYLEEMQRRWEKKTPKVFSAALAGQHSRTNSRMIEDAELKRRDSVDYHKFLRRFAVPREEAILDMDSFDYIPYYYGLACYAGEIAKYQEVKLSNSIPFIEPLEYSEVNRLDEIAIAIDTSGSCSGKIVRRFLEETWSILRQRENFFSRMRLHLIQCDLMIQEHRIFTSVEEWEDYLPELKIHGHGDTDFTPVFDYLNKLIKKREIRHLRGLLYFTDGDGIFPTAAPPFDTAFVFLNEQTEKHEIPGWAIRLNLQLPEEFW